MIGGLPTFNCKDLNHQSSTEFCHRIKSWAVWSTDWSLNQGLINMEARSGQNCSNKIAPQVSFFSHCFTFYELAVYFHRRYKFLFWGGCFFFFGSLNYFNLVWLNFLWVLRMSFFTHTANYFWLELRIIFYLWYWELFFSLALVVSGKVPRQQTLTQHALIRSIPTASTIPSPLSVSGQLGLHVTTSSFFF